VSHISLGETQYQRNDESMMKAAGLRAQAHDKQSSDRSANLLFCYVLEFYEIKIRSEDVQPNRR
jgi:hypothetical protein